MYQLSEICDYWLSRQTRRTTDYFAHFVPCLAIALLGFLGIGLPAPVSADPAILSLLRSSALAGDLRPVSRWVAGLEQSPTDDAPDQLSLVLLQQYRDRFVTFKESNGLSLEDSLTSHQASDPVDRLATEVIAAYQEYWRLVLTRTVPAGQADQELKDALERLLGKPKPARIHDEVPSSHVSSGIMAGDVFSRLEQTLAQQGLASSAATTAPWRDLYIWAEQYTQTFKVELTDGVEEVTVTFIEQPLVQGWQHYASLDLLSTSGWATQQGLFCLCWSYDLESAAFQVSWLKHETRHSVDFRKYPGMPEEQMEYRAKLTELAFSGQEVSSLLRQFSDSGSASADSAHSAANYRVSRDIYREIFQQELPADEDPWQLLGPGRVGPAAVRLLQRDTEQRL